MTRTKKKSSSPEPSVVDAAWAAFFEKSAVEDPNELRKQGWRSAYDLMQSTNESRAVITRRLDADPNFERKAFRIFHRGRIRELIFFRPKLKG
jgi:hypothetical protein